MGINLTIPIKNVIFKIFISFNIDILLTNRKNILTEKNIKDEVIKVLNILDYDFTKIVIRKEGK